MILFTRSCSESGIDFHSFGPDRQRLLAGAVAVWLLFLPLSAPAATTQQTGYRHSHGRTLPDRKYPPRGRFFSNKFPRRPPEAAARISVPLGQQPHPNLVQNCPTCCRHDCPQKKRR